MTDSGLPGCPIRKSPVHWMVGSYPGLIAAVRVLLRLPTPRHPPGALFLLVILLPEHDHFTRLLMRKDQILFLSFPIQLSMNRPSRAGQAMLG